MMFETQFHIAVNRQLRKGRLLKNLTTVHLVMEYTNIDGTGTPISLVAKAQQLILP
jgi:hypothetical protein